MTSVRPQSGINRLVCSKNIQLEKTYVFDFVCNRPLYIELNDLVWAKTNKINELFIFIFTLYLYLMGCIDYFLSI